MLSEKCKFIPTQELLDGKPIKAADAMIKLVAPNGKSVELPMSQLSDFLHCMDLLDSMDLLDDAT